MKEPYEIEEEKQQDHRAKHHVREFFDQREKARKHPVKFTPRRRGPAQIKFPMRAKKALMLLTGKTRNSTLERAKTAYRHYAVARNMVELGMGRLTAERHAAREIQHNLDSDWTFEFFKEHAESYAKYSRKNFDAVAHQKRLLKIFSDLSAK